MRSTLIDQWPCEDCGVLVAVKHASVQAQKGFQVRAFRCAVLCPRCLAARVAVVKAQR